MQKKLDYSDCGAVLAGAVPASVSDKRNGCRSFVSRGV
jgi:hypothetical protein